MAKETMILNCYVQKSMSIQILNSVQWRTSKFSLQERKKDNSSASSFLGRKRETGAVPGEVKKELHREMGLYPFLGDFLFMCENMETQFPPLGQ